MIKNSDSDRSTEMILEVDGTEIPDIRTFSYVSDVLQLACPFSAEIPDPLSRWSKLIRKGSAVRVYLRHPDVNEGQRTLKVTGRVTQVAQGSRQGTGRVLRVTGSDLGWHLMHDFGTLGYKLSRSSYKRLLETVIRSSWGFRGIRFGDGNSLNRQVKLGRKQKVLQYTANNEVPLQYIGIEPGEQVSSLITDVARFSALLVTVSADGYLQAWNPDYERNPDYAFEYHGDSDSQRILNNVEDVEVVSSADSLYTSIVCVGEILLQLDQVNPDDPHPGRKIGSYTDKDFGTELLPFRNSQIYTDTEQFSPKYAQANAEWKFRRNLFDSWMYKCSSPYHHQGGIWYEADTICAILDTVNHDDFYSPPKNIVGRFWVQSVDLHWDKDGGGGTAFIIRKRNLLKAPVVGQGGGTPYDRNKGSKAVVTA